MAFITKDDKEVHADRIDKEVHADRIDKEVHADRIDKTGKVAKGLTEIFKRKWQH